MLSRKWSTICAVAVLAVTGSAAFAQDHRGGLQAQNQPQNQRVQNVHVQQQNQQNRADQYTDNNGFRAGDRNGQHFQSQGGFNDPRTQARGWNEGTRYYQAPVLQRRQTPGWGFRFQLGSGFDRDVRSGNRPVSNDRGFRPYDHPKAYR